MGGLSMVVSSVLLAGCYTLEPAKGPSPELGTRIAVDINDVGRVALGGSMGTEISQVEGRLISNTNDEYLLAVDAVRFLRGNEQVWTGEPVRIKKDYTSNSYERRSSRGHTLQ